MDDKFHKPGLYKWKRQTPTRLYSRSQNVTTNDDIKDWIKKVEDATNKAADATFGPYYSSGRERGRFAALRSVQQLHEHDEVHSEAQDLLTQWMNEKVILNDDLDIDDEDWPRIKARSEVKAEWDHLLADNTDDWDVMKSPRSQYANTPTDNFFDLENLDETSAVESIMQRMLGKQVVQDEFLNDLGLDDGTKKKDPRLKMELRHQQVKENRERREKELEKKRRALREKKDAHLKAKQIIMKEEQDKELRSKREEMEIKKDMARIRKQMQEDRKKMEEEALRRKKETWELEDVSRTEVDRRVMEENKQKMLRQLEHDEKRRVMFKKLEHFQAKQAAKNLLTLQQHFSAWYKIVLERRLHMGRARALSDWKTLLRAWNAWRSYVRSQRIDVETKQFERSIIEINRKNQQAQKHYRCTLLKKYLTAWQLYVHQEVERREMEETQNRTRSKMMALLDAAATGKLWNEKKADEEEENKKVSGRHAVSDEDKINELFGDGKRPQSVPLSSRSGSTISNVSRSRPHSSRLPTEPWQVTRRHANLTKQELLQLGRGDQVGVTTPADLEQGQVMTHTDLEIRRRFGKQPWMNSPYVVNNLEHRYTAQQKMLHEQQRQIRDQQRLLEELQYNQTNQTLQKQAEEQRVVTEQLSRQPVPKGSPRQKSVVGEQQEQVPWQLGPKGQMLQQQDGGTGEPRRLAWQPETEEGSLQDAGGESREREQEVGGDRSSRQLGVEPQLNNMCDVHQHQGRIASQQHNTVARDKETNITLDTARTKSSMATPRTAFPTARSDLSSRSGATTSASSNKYLKVLKNMEERASERTKLKAEREEKRKKAEEEKMAMLLAHEEELRREAEEEKRARIEAYREKKRLEKQREIDKQQQAERLRELNRVADAHYLRSIVKYRGVLAFRKLVQMSRDAETRAAEHHTRHVVRKVFVAWHDHVTQQVQEKNYLADEMFKFLLLKRCLSRWKNYKHCMKIMEDKSRRFHQQNLLGKIVTAWAHFAMEEKIASWEKQRIAKDHYLRMIQKRVLKAWRQFPDELKKEKEREKRRIEMMKKVQMFIPDYEGAVDESVDIS